MPNLHKHFIDGQWIDTGVLSVNAGTIGVEIQLPFGGMKVTGNGHREAGEEA